MTFNEARAALAIGCKVRLSHWVSLRRVISMNVTWTTLEFPSGRTKIIFTPENHLISHNWEIYHENQGSNTSS